MPRRHAGADTGGECPRRGTRPDTGACGPGPGLGERIEARIAGEERRSASRGTLRTATVSALAAAAAAAAVVLGLDLARSDQAPGPVLEAVSVDETGTVEATADSSPTSGAPRSS